MPTKSWTRRALLTHTAKATAAATLSSLVPASAAFAQQMPAPQPLEDSTIQLITTTEASPWQKAQVYKPTFTFEMLNLNISLAKAPMGDPIEGFGGCFNDLGWTSLSALAPNDKDAILRELFHPTEGARFTYCRMPIGANDFSTEPYSYDETDGDFDLKHFTIDHDRQTLIPFIKAARHYQPNLRLWASPWTPPSWMKRNHFYAEGKAFGGMRENGIRPNQIGHEGEDMFLQEPRYFEAYANYFGRFIDAYRAEGIPVGMVMPQNEFNSAQNFPSCTWTAEGLGRFLHYLIPAMQKRDVAVFFGTLERGNPKLLETVMADPETARLLKGVGVQWAGKNALPAIHREYPALAIFQSEQECGDGQNTWRYTTYCWQLMKHYFRSGARGYMYWNISLAKGGLSTWGWPQNSLVTVDPEARTFRYNHDFYLFKHLTHFVDIGARQVEITGTSDDALCFLNPDKKVVILLRNPLPRPQLIQLQVDARTVAVNLTPDSISTLVLAPQQSA